MYMLLTLSLLSVGHAGTLSHRERACRTELAEIELAPTPDRAHRAIEAFMRCEGSKSGPPRVDLEEVVRGSLIDARYPATRSNAGEILDVWFDETVLRTMPTNHKQLDDYITTLDRQALRAKAERDDELSEACEARAKRLRKLYEIIDSAVAGK